MESGHFAQHEGSYILNRKAHYRGGSAASWTASPGGYINMRFTGLLRLAPALLLQTSLSASQPTGTAAPTATQPGGLILEINEGERRVRRTKAAGVVGLPDPFIIKVDQQNGGSPDLVMGYEELSPGQEISPHRHLAADEIIFVHKGTGLVSLGNRQAQVRTGGTVYIPRNTRIALKNNGSKPLGITFTFSRPGFEQLMRENSVLEGQPVTALSAKEQAKIQARHRWHTIREK